MNDDLIDDGDDAWSYSFPPSTESLPLKSEPEMLAESPNLDNSQLNNSIANLISPRGSGRNSEEAQSIKSSEPDPFQNGNAKSPKELYSASSFVNSTNQATNDSVSQSSNSLPLQSPFLSKSTPANPLTTREDANSIISKDSKGSNALSSLDFSHEDNVVDRLTDSPKKSYFATFKSNSNATLNLDNNSHKRTPTETDINEKSPKIITYRKSRRTTSDGNYQDVIEPGTGEVPKEKFDPKLYVDEKFKDSKYRYTTMKRNTDFHQLFKSLDLTDRLLDDFACALSRDILLQGRIYISEHYICFNSSLLGWVTNLIIPMEDIIKFEKKSTAGIFPNGILIETNDAKHTFASFISRDATFDFLKTVWEGTTGKAMIIEEDSLLTSPKISEENGGENDDSSKIESFIMSLDGDNTKDVIDSDELISDEESENLKSSVDTSNKIQIVSFKPESSYKNHGPDIHKPTEINDTVYENEIELCNEVLDVPMGVVFEILFGESSQEFFERFLDDHGSSELSDFGKFTPMESDSKKLNREYTFRKSLGYSIGPKSTICRVEEVIEHLNYNDYILVTTTTRTPDVPSGNSFVVKNIYRMTWGKKNTTNLQISFLIEWTGKSWLKSIIEKSTLTGQTDTCKDLIESVKEEIKDHTIVSYKDSNQEELETLEQSPSIEPIIEKKPIPEPSTLAIPSFSISEYIKSNTIYLYAPICVLLIIIILIQFMNYTTINETNKLLKSQIMMNKKILELLAKQYNQGEVLDQIQGEVLD